MFNRGMRGMNRGRRGGNQRGGYLMLMLLQLGSRVQRLERKPPVTLALMAFMIGIYLMPEVAPSLQEACLSPHNADLFRLIASGFLHAGDMHLYYNMSSLLYKGIQIELAAGSKIFAAMCSILLIMSHSLVVLVGLTIGDQLPFGGANGCAVGFSAVLFALKVVLNDEGGPSHSNIFGIVVPTKYAVWLELIVSSLISPSSSFIGHLCGILAGYIYSRCHVGRKLGELFSNGIDAERWFNPIGFHRSQNPNGGGFFGGMGDMFSGLFGGEQDGQQGQQDQQGRTYGRGTTGNSNSNGYNNNQQSREPSQRPPSVETAEELRRRRTARFN